jgi:cellulose synthase operon protein C
MFKVECLGCQAPYQVDERRVPEKGLKMRCPKCGTTFKVEPPTPSTTPSQAPAPANEAPLTSATARSPFTSDGIDPGRKLGKPQGSRDSLARTMIGVSSAEMELLKGAGQAAKPKAFRIPRPNQPTAEADPSPHVMPSMSPPSRDSIADAEASDAPRSSSEPSAALSLSHLPQPLGAPARAPSELPKMPGMDRPNPLELDFEEDLPVVASPQKRPPPRRNRPLHSESTTEDEADLPARLEDLDAVGLPAAVVSPARPLERAPLPPLRQESTGTGDLDLPAIAPRELTLAAHPFARGPAPKPAAAAAKSPLFDLPSVRGGGAVIAARKDSADLLGLPELLSTGLPAVTASGLPDVPSRGLSRVARIDSDLPDVLGGYFEASPVGLPEVRAADLPRNSDSGLPDVLAADLPDLHGTGLPQVADTGLPDVLAAGLPGMFAAGLPDVLAAGLPAVSPVGLPEVFAPGVSGFGRVDLPLARAADLPDLRAGHAGIGEVDLPGVGESLPSVAQGWGEANLPSLGETLPTAKAPGGGAGLLDGSESPFHAFGEAASDDPFAGSEADFGSAEGDDPFAVQASADGPSQDEFASLHSAEGDREAAGGRATGGGYGEVDIAGDPVEESALETADDMEFQAIPQRGSGSPGRAAASAAVHADSPDTDATGSTLELGPERKAPKTRQRSAVVAVAVCLATIAGGALALKPTIGPFGIHFVIDRIKRGEHERTLAKLVADAHEAGHRDTLAAVQPELHDVEKAREAAPRFTPLSARSALDHYKVALRYGPLPDVEATAKVAFDQLDPDADEPLDRLARAARSAASRSADAKAELETLGKDPDARELLGEVSLRDRDFAAALEVWTEIVQGQPTSARALFGLARAELGLGKLAEAMSRARQVLALSPEHVGAPILLLEAQRALRNGRDEQAATQALVAAVTRVLDTASPGEGALGHTVLGELHASQGRAGPAQQEFEAALVVDRGLPRALIGLGEVLHQVGRDSEALARFAAAAQAEPESIAARLGIAKSQIRLARLAEAQKLLAELGAAHPGHPDVIFWQGRAAQALGNHDGALASFRAAIVAGKGGAGSVEAYLALAKLQSDLGQLAAAQQTLSEARDKLPPSGPLHEALGEVAMSRADYASAYEQFQKALDLDVGDTRARFMGAVALTRLGRFAEALAAFQTVGQTDKDFPGLAVERGRLFEESGRNAEALAEYEAAMKTTPDDVEVQIRVGCARMIAGQTLAAQELLEKAAKARPRSAEANYCLGRALFDLERYVDGMVRLERAVGIDPTRAIYHLYVGWVASELGRQTEAQAAFDDAIGLDKGLADAYWQRGRLHLKQGAAKDAIVDLERARQLKPSRYDAIADLAVAYSDVGRMPKALDLWEEAIAKDADNPTWHFRYGKLLSSSGNGAMAAAHIKRAIDLLADARAGTPSGSKPKPPPWLWQAHYLLARELGKVPAAIPHWQAYLRLSPRDDPYRPEAERSLRDLGQPWQER